MKGNLQRRTLLKAAALAPLVGALPLSAAADSVRAAQEALVQSNLVYLSPFKTNGQLSSCQSEVWYVMLGRNVLVCTDTDSWRAPAPRQGLSRTRMWVGDLGYWKRADYQSLPATEVSASIETDEATISQALDLFGLKYSAEWGSWESRFRNGLADGSRTLLRYQLS